MALSASSKSGPRGTGAQGRLVCLTPVREVVIAVVVVVVVSLLSRAIGPPPGPRPMRGRDDTVEVRVTVVVVVVVVVPFPPEVICAALHVRERGDTAENLFTVVLVVVVVVVSLPPPVTPSLATRVMVVVAVVRDDKVEVLVTVVVVVVVVVVVPLPTALVGATRHMSETGDRCDNLFTVVLVVLVVVVVSLPPPFWLPVPAHIAVVAVLRDGRVEVLVTAVVVVVFVVRLSAGVIGTAGHKRECGDQVEVRVMVVLVVIVVSLPPPPAPAVTRDVVVVAVVACRGHNISKCMRIRELRPRRKAGRLLLPVSTRLAMRTRAPSESVTAARMPDSMAARRPGSWPNWNRSCAASLLVKVAIPWKRYSTAASEPTPMANEVGLCKGPAPAWSKSSLPGAVTLAGWLCPMSAPVISYTQFTPLPTSAASSHLHSVDLPKLPYELPHQHCRSDWWPKYW